ncbi:hypothetical protein [Streptomyces cinnamoneus]|uniref:hypothetical protein n=1 Tax=Streptomyces cinnamoneus TaxID=53446 RepID=UPI0011B015A2|nr:hypothetical protein [Streptomyces cinnamoneus]
MSESEVGYEEFLSRGRDHAQAQVVHKALQHLATGGDDDVLREMAREVLSGRIGLREAMRVGAYADALGEHVQPVRAAWEQMPQAEREQYTHEARQLLDASGDALGEGVSLSRRQESWDRPAR